MTNLLKYDTIKYQNKKGGFMTLTNCPNDKTPLDITANMATCPKCGYAFSISAPKKPSVSKYTAEVNQAIKELLVIARLTGESVPWKKEWIIIPKRNYDSNRLYSGINRWLLSFDSEICYITKNSIEKHNGKLTDNAKMRLVVAWIPPHLSKEEKAKLSPEEQKKALSKKYPFMVTKSVYRAKDVEGLKPRTFEGDKENKRFDNIEAFIKSIKGLTLEEGGNQPHYKRISDVIVVPRIEQFESSEDYYLNLFHELVHWTGNKNRLNRDEKKFQHGEEYGREELIAEMGAAYLCHYFGIPVKENSVNYIDGWLLKIDSDPNCLVSAGQQAEKVLKYFGLAE